MAALDKAFPQEFLSIADLLGIDIRKPVELWHCGQDETKLYFTGGWFHAVGRILSGRNAWKQIGETHKIPDLETLADGFDFGFTDDLALVSEPFKDKHFVQIDFITHVPRVLPDSEWLIPIPNP